MPASFVGDSTKWALHASNKQLKFTKERKLHTTTWGSTVLKPFRPREKSGYWINSSWTRLRCEDPEDSEVLEI